MKLNDEFAQLQREYVNLDKTRREELGVPRQPFLPVASVVFAAFAPCLTVDFKLYGCDNL